jgi:hypothetical protein
MSIRKVVLLLSTALALIVAALAVPTASAAPAPQAAPSAPSGVQPKVQTKAVTYAPVTIPAAVEGGDHGHTGNVFSLGVQTPCTDCFITKISPDLVYADGSNANVDTGPMVHHFVMYNQLRRDPLCGGNITNPSFFLGERFMAAGNERTVLPSPEGYGYYVEPNARWNMIADYMNHAYEPKTVFVKITWDFVPAAGANLKKLQPLWLSIPECFPLDTYVVQPGRTTATFNWSSSLSGKIVGTGGHLHNSGQNIKLSNATTGQQVCDSKAGYGESPEYINVHGGKELSSMSICVGSQGVGQVKAGETLRIESTYDAKEMISDAMGIMMVFLEAQ